jgi:hypothetical protein
MADLLKSTNARGNEMKNRLIDLNNHLFSQLERLTEEGLSGEQIEQEVRRADAVVAVSEQIIRNADTALKAASLVANHGDKMRPMLSQFFRQPPALESEKKPDGDGK